FGDDNSLPCECSFMCSCTSTSQVRGRREFLSGLGGRRRGNTDRAGGKCHGGIRGGGSRSPCLTKKKAVINWKGGCGKTTVATHLAVALATSGLETGLADYDRQQTAKLWRRLRSKGAAAICLVDWRKEFGACPGFIQRLVVDCPPSLRAK